MESDVPLIEIAGEDDSLLQLISGDAVSGSNNTGKSTIDDAYFFCSPIHPRRSKASEGVMVNEIPRKPCSPLCRDGLNKENTNTNNTYKVDELKLSLQPQQMKKKKKGGGYNLRKSLAWDRAFFTDEGVLNSEELSMITGNASSNGLLSVIHEDESCMTDSADQHVIEEKLFKGLPESPSNKMRIIGGSPLTKHGSSPKNFVATGSAAKRKVLSDRDIGRSGSKRSGCPRPVGSSSLKRPANVNTMKSPMKEPRASRLPVPKSNSSLLPRTSKSLTVGANDLKRNQIAHPVKSNTTRSGPNNAKVSPTGKSFTSKSSVQQAKRNVASSLVKGSLTKIHCPPAIEANNALEGIPTVALSSTSQSSYGRNERSKKDGIPQVTSKQALPLTGRALHGRFRRTAAPEMISKQALPPTSHASHGREEGSRKTAVPLPDTGVNSLRTQLPTSKPSGLRMPSPSLGFFHQSKASSPSPLKTISQPCINPNLKKVDSVDTIHELRPLSSLGKKLNMINDATIMANSNGKCSILGSDVLSAVNHATMDEVEPFLEVKSCPKVELNIQSSSSSYAMTENQLKFNSILVHEDEHSTGPAKPDITEKVLHKEDVESQTNDNEVILQRGLCEQLETADKSMEVGFVLAPKSKDRDKPHVASHPSSAATFPGLSGTSDIYDHQLLEDEPNALSQKNPVVILKFNSEAASSTSSMVTSSNDLVNGDLNINELDTEERDLLKLWACGDNRICDEDPMVCEKDVSLTEDFQASEEIQTYCFQKVADVSPKFQNSSSFELTSDILSGCRFEDQDKDGSTFDKKSGNPHVEGAQKVALGGKKPEQLDFQSSSSIDNILQLDDSILDEISIVPEESKHANSLQCVDLKEPEGTGSCKSEPEVSRIFSHDCRSNLAEIVESQNVDSVVSLPEDNQIVVKSYNLDSQLNNQCRDRSLELESDEIRITGVMTSHNVGAGFSGGGDFTPKLNVKVQVESTSGVDDVIEDKGSGTENCIVQFERSCPAAIVNLPADGPVIKLPEDATVIKLLADAPIIKLQEDAPVIKLPADAPVIKLPADAVPFSDEWLAALEEAGEEILTKKSGAVQNSPPNKSEPEVGPWSPVKRKANQVIGPFDCTKHTNNPPGSL